MIVIVVKGDTTVAKKNVNPILRVRVNREIYEKADHIIKEMRLTHAQVIEMLYHQIGIHRKIPFNIELGDLTLISAKWGAKPQSTGVGKLRKAPDVLYSDGWISNQAHLVREKEALEQKDYQLKQAIERAQKEREEKK